MAEKGLEAVVLRRNPNLAWAIAGRVHVPTTIDAACFDLIITKDSAVAITNVVEAPRLIAEEFPAEVSVQTVSWSQGCDPLLPSGAHRSNPELPEPAENITITDQVADQLAQWSSKLGL